MTQCLKMPNMVSFYISAEIMMYMNPFMAKL